MVSLRNFIPALILSSFFFIGSGAESLQNITIVVPNGSTYYQDTNELCLPASWIDILTFFTTNYIAHAATVRTKAGDKTWSRIELTIICLLFPAWGLSRAISDFQSFATFATSDIEKATRAGALVMVQRSNDWKPAPGDFIEHSAIWRGKKPADPGTDPAIPEQAAVVYLKSLDPSWTDYEWKMPDIVNFDTEFAFEFKLPDGYRFIRVPRHALVKKDDPDFEYMDIKPSYNAIAIIIAVLQLFFAAASLYQAWTNQISRFGYAAFGLTVTPYAVMSFLNLLGSLLCPSFEETYLVRSRILDEAVLRLEERPRRLPVAGDLIEVEHELRGFHSLERLKQKGRNVIPGLVAFSSGVNGELVATMHDSSSALKEEASGQNNTSTWLVKEMEWDHEHPFRQRDFDRLTYPNSNPFKMTTHPFRRFTCWLSGYRGSYEREPEEGWDEDDLQYTLTDRIGFCIAFAVYGAIIGIIGGTSHFQPEKSTLAQRVLTMSWLSAGLSLVVIRESGVFLEDRIWVPWRMKDFVYDAVHVLAFLLSGFAIGGFVVVGQMLRSYGTCLSLS